MYDSRTVLEARLIEIRAAITKARNAQTVSTGDSSLSRANLAALLAEEKDVLKKINLLDSVTGGGMSNYVRFYRPVS